MLNEAQIKFFKENGYLCVPNILNKDSVIELRKNILSIFESGKWKNDPHSTPQVLSNVYQNYPEFIQYTLNNEIISIISDLLDSTPVLIPETTIHHKFYTGWHKDTTSIEKAGKSFHKNEDALFLQCGFYLQDNNQDGGGLTVMEKSHNENDLFIHPHTYSLSIFNRILLKLGLYKEGKNKRLNPSNHTIFDIPSKAGDFVIFDFRLNHRATLPFKKPTDSIPFEKSKIAFFNAFTRDNKNAELYLNFIKNRSEPFYQSLNHYSPSQELIEISEKLKFKVIK